MNSKLELVRAVNATNGPLSAITNSVGLSSELGSCDTIRTHKELGTGGFLKDRASWASF